MMDKNILLIENEPRLKEFWSEVLQDEGFNVISLSPEEDIPVAKNSFPDLVFLGTDLGGENIRVRLEKMQKINPELLVITPANPQELARELEAIKLQGLNYQDHPIRIDHVRAAIREAVKIKELKERYNFKNLVGQSPCMQAVFKSISQIITSRATTILITGETGTGKEEVASAIHYNSDRGEMPFLAISCTTMPETLMESELFGHEAGAFTDARSTKKGLLELAHGGTVFLDEIGDMSLGLQAKLLRFLEERNFRRIGGIKDISVDVRIIAATNKDLTGLVDDNKFRNDLYYRLKVFPISIPPLRDRKEDISLLAGHFITGFNAELKKEVRGLTFSAIEKLTNYDWPGNVRELRNVIERAMILSGGDFINSGELILERASEVKPPEEYLSLEENEKRLIKMALAKTNGNQTKAAELLGITRFALRNRLKKYNIVHYLTAFSV